MAFSASPALREPEMPQVWTVNSCTQYPAHMPNELPTVIAIGSGAGTVSRDHALRSPTAVSAGGAFCCSQATKQVSATAASILDALIIRSPAVHPRFVRSLS